MSSRVVRIPQSRPHKAVRGARSDSAHRPREPADALERRPNVAGTRRAVRLSLVFGVALGIVFLVLAALGRSEPRGTSAGAGFDLLVLGVAGLAVAVGGIVLSLHSAPRRVEVGPTAIVVVGRWGRRTEWAPPGQLKCRLARRYPPSLLSGEPVALMELRLPGRPSRTYLVAEGLFPVDPD